MAPTDGSSSQPTRFADAGPGPCDPWNLAVDEDYVYWTCQHKSSLDPSNGSVMRMGINEASPRELASGQGKPWGIAVDENYVYWTNYESGTVMRTSISGSGLLTTLAVDQPHPQGITVDDKNVYWVDEGPSDDRGAGSVMKWAK
jgi:hypothetical protein